MSLDTATTATTTVQLPPEVSCWHGRFVTAVALDLMLRHGRDALRSSTIPRPAEADAQELAEMRSRIQSQQQKGDIPSLFATPLTSLASLDVQMFTKAFDAIDVFLKASFGLRLRVVEEPWLALCICSANEEEEASRKPMERCLSRNELTDLSTKVNAPFGLDMTCFRAPGGSSDEEESQPPTVYRDLLKHLVPAFSKGLAECVPDIFPQNVIDAFMTKVRSHPQTAELEAMRPTGTTASGSVPVALIPNVPIGGFMISYDLCFETAPSHARISHPDFALLSKEHHDRWFRDFPTGEQDRLHLHYLSETLTVVAHEMVHVYQGVADQKDSSHYKWSAEHDASVPAASLYFYVAEHCKDPVVKAALGGGAAEAATIIMRDFENIGRKFSAKDMQQLHRLKHSFGTFDAHFDDDFDHCRPFKESMVKTSLSYENLRRPLSVESKLGRLTSTPEEEEAEHRECVAVILRAVFADRFGVDTFKVAPSYERMRALAKVPVDASPYRQHCSMEEVMQFCAARGLL